ncbi:MAG: hypothetical protein WBM99_15065 [Psychromonas sp.]
MKFYSVRRFVAQTAYGRGMWNTIQSGRFNLLLGCIDDSSSKAF